MAGEEEQVLGGDGADCEGGAERDEGECRGVGGVDDVGVAAGDSAYFVGMGAGPEAGGDGGRAETQGAGGQSAGCDF